MSSDRLTAARTPRLAAFAREVADPSRAAMLIALTDGRAWTVGELAYQVGVARNTVSEHVRRLVQAGLVTEARQGRHCYLRLAGPQVAHAVEAMSLASRTRAATPSLRGRRHDDELAAGRTCYKHLAGKLGVSGHGELPGDGHGSRVVARYVLRWARVHAARFKRSAGPRAS